MSVVEATEAPSQRQLPDGVLDFEPEPYHRYFWTPEGKCSACDGSGREPGAREGTTRKCKACEGSGLPKRRKLTSVSAIKNGVCPKDLSWWGEACGVAGAMEAIRRGAIQPDHHTDLEAVETVRELRLGMAATRDAAADRGKFSVHAPLEAFMRTGEVPSIGEFPIEHAGFIQGICALLLKHDPEPEQVEEMVCHPELGYAGRSDAVVRVQRLRRRWDFKSSPKGQVYPESHVQVRLYEMAAVRSGDDPCDLLDVVVLDERGGCRVVPCACDEATALAALAWYRASRPIESECKAFNDVARKAAKL